MCKENDRIIQKFLFFFGYIFLITYIWLVFDTLYSFLHYFRKNLNLILVANKWILTWLRFVCLVIEQNVWKPKVHLASGILNQNIRCYQAFLVCPFSLLFYVYWICFCFSMFQFLPRLLLWLPETTEIRKLQVRSFSL